jgi:hypothetical protein
MRVLFDHGTPRGLISALVGHTITTAQAEGWDRLGNGDLLDAAERAGMDLLLTTDRRIRYQQNLATRRIAILVLSGTTKWARVRLHAQRIAAAVAAAQHGSYTEIDIPFD